MRTFHTVLVALVLSSSATTALAAETKTLFTCTTERDGAPTFAVEYTDAEPGRQFIVKYAVDGSAPARVEVSQPHNQVWGYGNTYIVTESLGRSGYAHVYANLESGVSLIDVNVFLNQAVSTDGPQTDYKCARAQ